MVDGGENVLARGGRESEKIEGGRLGVDAPIIDYVVFCTVIFSTNNLHGNLKINLHPCFVVQSLNDMNFIGMF